MSDPDAMPDPIDQAYVEAEAVLSDDAARAERRARVLAAVASQGAAPARAPLWRRSGWLVAASVAGLSLIIASQLYRPIEPPPPRPAKAGPAVSPPADRGVISPPAKLPDHSSVQPLPRFVPKPPPPVIVPAPAAPRPVELQTAPPVSEPAPPPPPPPPPEAASRGGISSESQATAAASNATGGEVVGELVVVGEKRHQSLQKVPVAVSAFTGKQRDIVGIQSVQDMTNFAPGVALPELAARLRAAAAAGRAGDVKSLLKHHVPVDGADDGGNTALMEAVQADHPAVAKLLVQHGASLDQQNQAGQSARDMAKTVGDPKLDQALGLSP